MSAPLSPSDTAVPPGSGGLTAQQALVAAAAMRAAASAPNPVDVLAWTAGQTASIAADTATWAKNAILGLWATVNPYDKRQVEKFAATAAGYMGSAQAAVGRVAAAAQVRQLASIGITVDGIPSLQIDVRGPAVAIRNGKAILLHHAVDVAYADGDTITITPAEMTTEALFMRPAAGFRWAQSQGRADAAEISQARIESLVDDNLMLAQRLASAEVLAQAVDLDRRKPNRRGPRVTGYRRVIHPELSHGGTCGMCIVAADQIYHVSELMPIHARCKCTIAAITADHDPGDDLNKADLKKLYKDAGGTSAAHLKRTRYKRDNHGELGPVLVPKKPYKPRDKAKQAAAAATAVTGKTETKAEIAARHLPGMEKSLADLRTRGLSEDDQRVAWHKQEIAKLQADLKNGESAAGQLGDKARSAAYREESPRPSPIGGGGGGDKPPEPPRQDGPIEHNEDPADRLSRLLADQATSATREQRASVLRWQGKDERYYEQVQQAALGNSAAGDAIEVAEDLQELMAPLPEPVEVWRGIRDAEKSFGIPADRIEELVGTELESAAFFATSLDRDLAETEFTRPGRQPAMYKIAAQAGTPALWVPPLGSREDAYQRELLFPPGIVLRILGVDRSYGVPIVEVEVSDGEVGR